MKKDMEETKDLLLMNRVVQALLNEELSSLEVKIFAILQSLAGARCSVDIRSLAVLFEISREDINAAISHLKKLKLIKEKMAGCCSPIEYNESE